MIAVIAVHINLTQLLQLLMKDWFLRFFCGMFFLILTFSLVKRNSVIFLSPFLPILFLFCVPFFRERKRGSKGKKKMHGVPFHHFLFIHLWISRLFSFFSISAFTHSLSSSLFLILVCLSLCLSPYLSVSYPLSMSHYLCESICIYLSLSLSLPLSLPLSLSFSLLASFNI